MAACLLARRWMSTCLDTPFVDAQTPHFIDIGGNDILALLLSVGCSLFVLLSCYLISLPGALHEPLPSYHAHSPRLVAHHCLFYECIRC